MTKKIKKVFLMSILIVFIAGLSVFLAFNIWKAESFKKTDAGPFFNPQTINIDDIESDIDFANSIPEYKILFTGLISRDIESSFADILGSYENNIETVNVKGIRSDGELIEVGYTGIKLSKLLENIDLLPDAQNIIILATDLYAANFSLGEALEDDIYIAWKKDGQFLNPSEDGILKIVQDNGPTNKWVKNPVIFNFTGQFIDSVDAGDRLAANSIDFVSEQNFFTLAISGVPSIDIDEWSLKISGLVKNPQVLDYKDILLMPQVSVYATLETISNPIGGSLIGNAIWTGVPLKYILEEAVMDSSAYKVIFYCEDGYSTAITIEEALKEDVIIAYNMNGRALAGEHGFPARVVIPEKYGMKWAKWINEIEVTDEDYKGFWEIRGWSDYAGRDRPEERFD